MGRLAMAICLIAAGGNARAKEAGRTQLKIGVTVVAPCLVAARDPRSRHPRVACPERQRPIIRESQQRPSDRDNMQSLDPNVEGTAYPIIEVIF